ncbi:MAG: selenocysteine-specific translation elongation factor [Gemmatimonadales bacterium]
MIIGTAGHIDHGKSALVTALTGRTMDRLAEERRRGITIDLNFAPLELGDGVVAGVVDVPGHEDFVRTMVAGASGVDLALLVVAADEGIMPQTLEHLAVLEHLRIPFGIPVVTKADLVDREWLELVAGELMERLSRSAVEFGPPVCVSVKTGEGIETLRERIAERSSALALRPRGDLFRLPVDRAFSVAGVGTVVTGTVWSGRVAVGDEVVLLPLGANGRVRSIETHGRAVVQGEPGARTAVGIAGIPRDEVSRGAVLVAAGSVWESSTALDVALTLDAGAPRPVVHRSRIRLHLGTAEIIGRVKPRAPIEPGSTGLARLALEGPIVARGGDRFVIRSFSPVATIGGGVVLDPIPPLRRTRWPEGLDAIDLSARLAALVERRTGGLAVGKLPLLLGVPSDRARAVAHAASELRQVGELLVTTHLLERLGARCLDLLRRHHREQPLDRGMPLETLRRALSAPEAAVEAVLDDLVRTGRMRRLDGLAALAGFAPRAEGGDAAVDELVRVLEHAGLTPPSVSELARQTGRRDAAAMLRLAAAAGKVEAVERDRYYARPALDRFVQAIRETGAEAAIVPSQLRERLGITRKYLIPLLEWADMKGVTAWVDGVRRARVSPPA